MNRKSYCYKTEHYTIWLSKNPIRWLYGDFIKFEDRTIEEFHKYIHKEDGPAIEYSDGKKYWYWNGEYINVKSQEEFETWRRFKNFK